MALLEVTELRTWFEGESGTIRAVDGVSFSLDEGEVVGIVGASGSGKTVTALSVLGLVPRPSGRIQEGSSIRYRGEELVGVSPARMRAVRGRRVGMVFQDPMSSLNPVLTVGEQISESLRLHRGASRREARDLTVELLDEVGIPEPRQRRRQYPHELSGGMCQRVMIAMALAPRPELIIADEPTTALDVTTQAQILALLDRVRRDRDMTLLLITHDLAVVARTCRRVLVMSEGTIVEAGSVEEVFSDPRRPETRRLLGPRGGSAP